MTTQTATTALTSDQMLAMIAKLQADNAALKASASEPRKLSMKVSEKGALSIYGLGRFPVTLYRTQWERLFAPESVKAIGAFIETNAKLLTVKD